MFVHPVPVKYIVDYKLEEALRHVLSLTTHCSVVGSIVCSCSPDDCNSWALGQSTLW